MTAPITNTPALAAEQVRRVLAAAGFPAARTGAAADFGTRPVVTAGYVVTEGGAATAGPLVNWDQRLSDDALDAKLVELQAALTAAGFQVERETQVDQDGVEWYGWTLEVRV